MGFVFVRRVTGTVGVTGTSSLVTGVHGAPPYGGLAPDPGRGCLDHALCMSAGQVALRSAYQVSALLNRRSEC